MKADERASYFKLLIAVRTNQFSQLKVTATLLVVKQLFTSHLEENITSWIQFCAEERENFHSVVVFSVLVAHIMESLVKR